MRKFKYGFNASRKERNTLNRQISRMEERGYIFPENIREKIKDPKTASERLYRLSKYKPMIQTEAGPRRVIWETSGQTGKRLEEAFARVRRQNREAVKKGIKGYFPVDVGPERIGPTYVGARIARMTEKEIKDSAKRQIESFIARSKLPIETKLARQDKQRKENVIKSLSSVFAITKDKRVNELFNAIKTKIRKLPHNKWFDLFEYTGISIKALFSSDYAEVSVNLYELLDFLDIDWALWLDVLSFFEERGIKLKREGVYVE